MLNQDFFFPEKFIIKRSGVEVRAQLMKSGEILVLGDDAVFLVDDVLARTLANGVVEHYTVIDAQYNQGAGPSLPSITKLKVAKNSVSSSRSAP